MLPGLHAAFSNSRSGQERSRPLSALVFRALFVISGNSKVKSHCTMAAAQTGVRTDRCRPLPGRQPGQQLRSTPKSGTRMLAVLVALPNSDTPASPPALRERRC
eukprot:1202180-Prymnesium_polylepis.1